MTTTRLAMPEAGLAADIGFVVGTEIVGAAGLCEGFAALGGVLAAVTTAASSDLVLSSCFAAAPAVISPAVAGTVFALSSSMSTAKAGGSGLAAPGRSVSACF